MRTSPPTRWFAMAVVLSVVFVACTGGGTDTAVEPATSSPGEGAGADPAPLVDPSEILSGGPPPDGIPPIDDPKFLDPDDVTFVADREPVLAVEVEGDARAYPLQIMMWHEIVNDEVGGTPVSVTFCPLCNTGIAFERPTIDGELLDFGTSGKLYNSNLIMWDRQTSSYWAQATGQAIMGELTGEQLVFVPARILSFGDWRAEHPDGKVLSDDTGHGRRYGENPYVSYDTTDRPFLFRGEPDERLAATVRVLGMTVQGDVVAFPYDELMAGAEGDWSAVSTEVGDLPVAVFWKAGTASALDGRDIATSRDVGAAAVFIPEAGGEDLTFRATSAGIVDEQTGSTWEITGRAIAGQLEGERLHPAVAIESFWFDWAAFHPDTRVFGQE
jgi:hypothetical protein